MPDVEQRQHIGILAGAIARLTWLFSMLRQIPCLLRFPRYFHKRGACRPASSARAVRCDMGKIAYLPGFGGIVSREPAPNPVTGLCAACTRLKLQHIESRSFC
jgi:hypothetical protein